MISLLLIEDDERLASLIKRSLEGEDFQVSVAFDGEMGLKLALRQDFSVVISDVLLPKINGLELCKSLRAQKPQQAILMLTALGTTDDKVDGFDAGADDYLVKPFEMRELVVRLRALVKRHSALPVQAEQLQYADLHLNIFTKQVKRSGQEISLTPKEFSLLQYFMSNPERVLGRAEIAEKVWETHYDTGTNFIDVYINYLRKKIDKGFDTKLIHTKSGMGFVLKKE
jgi:DNA-binding response OmpR family regulator